jgi:hypothetical protein
MSPQKPSDPNANKLPDKIQISGGVSELTVETNSKTVANAPFSINTEPYDASHSVI